MKKLTVLTGILLLGLSSMNVNAQETSALTRPVFDYTSLSHTELVKLVKEYENLVVQFGAEADQWQAAYNDIESKCDMEKANKLVNENLDLQRKITSLEARLEISETLFDSSKDTNERLRTKLQEKQVKENARAVIIYR